MEPSSSINHGSPAPARSQRKRWLLFGYYFGIPLTVALISGWNKAYLGPAADKLLSLIFWLVLQGVTWAGAVGGSTLIWYGLKRWRPPLALILLLGIVVGWFATQPLLYPFIMWTRQQVGLPMSTEPLTAWQVTMVILNGLLPGTALWLSVNYLYDRVLGVPRFRYGPKATAARSTTDQPEPIGNSAGAASKASAQNATDTIVDEQAHASLLGRLPPAMRGQLLALEAEDHFVKVRTVAGTHLLYSRLSDAIKEAGEHTGIQIHRSFWVSLAAIDSYGPHGGGLSVRLKDGKRYPVSRSRRIDFLRRMEHGLQERGS